MSLPMSKLGWMAGVVDVKGRIIIKANKKRNTKQYVLAVTSKDGFLIRELSSLTGTKPEVRQHKDIPEWMRRGCVEHCPEAHVHVRDSNEPYPYFQVWTVTGASMAVILHNLSPFLMSDRPYDEAYNYILATVPVTGRGATQVMAALKRLEDLSWDLPEVFELALDNWAAIKARGEDADDHVAEGA